MSKWIGYFIVDNFINFFKKILSMYTCVRKSSRYLSYIFISCFINSLLKYNTSRFNQSHSNLGWCELKHPYFNNIRIHMQMSSIFVVIPILICLGFKVVYSIIAINNIFMQSTPCQIFVYCLIILTMSTH